MNFAFSDVSAIFRFLMLLLLVFSSFSAVLLFVVYVNKLVGLLLLAVKAYVFFVTGLLFDVGVGRLADGLGRAGSMASDLTHRSSTSMDPVSYGQPGRP